jgi:hypothetical protein
MVCVYGGCTAASYAIPQITVFEVPILTRQQYKQWQTHQHVRHDEHQQQLNTQSFEKSKSSRLPAPSKWDRLSRRYRYTLHCLLCRYVAKDTPNVSYVNCHQVIHNLREEAKASGGQGPPVVVAGHQSYV